MSEAISGGRLSDRYPACRFAHAGYSLSELDAGEFDHLAPLGVLVGDQLAVFGGAHRHRDAAELHEMAFHRIVVQPGFDLGLELVDDLARRIARRANAQTAGDLVARHGLAYGRHAGQRIDALRRCHRERPEVAGLDLAQARDDRIEYDV